MKEAAQAAFVMDYRERAVILDQKGGMLFWNLKLFHQLLDLVPLRRFKGKGACEKNCFVFRIGNRY